LRAERRHQPMLRRENIVRSFFPAIAPDGFSKASLLGRPAIVPINEATCDAKWGNKLAKDTTRQKIPPWRNFRYHPYRENGVGIYVN
jgi:hypothetical protein